jgi:hypothetical protein
VRRQELRLDGVEFSAPIGQTFLQPFPVELEVSTHDLGPVGREDGSDLFRRHPLTREHALDPAGRRACQCLVRAAPHRPMMWGLMSMYFWNVIV